MTILYVAAFLIILLEASSINKYFYFQCVSWDLLSIFIIILSLYSSKVKNIYVFTFAVSIFQDILTFGYGVNLVSKMLLVFLINSIKNKFVVSSIIIKSSIVILLSVFEIFIKTLFSYIYLGNNISICIGYIFYILLNFAVFYIYYLIKERSEQIG